MADELRDIAAQMQRAKERGITSEEFSKFQRSLEDIAKKNNVSVGKLAENIARSTTSAISSKIPTVGDIVGAVINSNPILKMVSILGGKVMGLISGSRVSKQDDAEALLEQLRQMANSDQEAQDQNKELVGDTSELLSQNQDILKKILEQAEILVRFQEQAASQKGLEGLQALDTDKTKTTGGLDLGSVEGGINDLVELQKQNFALGIAKSVSGLVKGIATAVAGFLGGTLVPLIAKAGGLLTGGAKFAGRLLGPLAVMVGGIYSFYEGFENAAKFFGDENVSTIDKIRYSIAHMFSSLVAPFEWLYEFITGKEVDMRTTFEHWFLDFTGKLGSYLVPLIEFGVKAFEWIGTQFQSITDGLQNIDISSIPSNLYNNIVGMFTSFGDRVNEEFQKKLDLGSSFIDGIKKQIMDFFSGMFVTLADSVAGIVSQIPMVGEDAAASIRSTVDGLRPQSQETFGKSEAMSEQFSHPPIQGNGMVRFVEASNKQVQDSNTARNMVERTQAKEETQQKAPMILAPNNTVNNNQNTTVVKREMMIDPPMSRVFSPSF